MGGNLGLWGVCFTHLQKYPQQDYNTRSVSLQCKLLKRIEETLYIKLFWPYLAQKSGENLPHRHYFSHTPESSVKVHANQLSCSYIKNFFTKCWKGYEIGIFTDLFLNRDPLKKIERKYKNCTATTFWSILLCTFKRNIAKMWGKLMTDGWPLQKLDWLCHKRSYKEKSMTRNSVSYAT